MEAVAILIPVLARPHRVAPLIADIEAATLEPHCILFIADSDDHDELAALELAGADYLSLGPHERRNYAAKINAGYRATTEPWVFSGADDLHFHPEWFTRATCYMAEGVDVIGTNDLCNPRVMTGTHSTHTLVRRSYLDEIGGVVDGGPGSFLNESYAHQYTDDEFIQTAMHRTRYAHAFDAIVEHLHPNAGKAPDDETYRRGRADTARSRQLFRQRSRLWR